MINRRNTEYYSKIPPSKGPCFGADHFRAAAALLVMSCAATAIVVVILIAAEEA